jgi:hypothetical protein
VPKFAQLIIANSPHERVEVRRASLLKLELPNEARG